MAGVCRQLRTLNSLSASEPLCLENMDYRGSHANFWKCVRHLIALPVLGFDLVGKLIPKFQYYKAHARQFRKP